MGERNWTNELEGHLRDWFAQFCAATGQPVPFAGLRINPTLGVDESRYFLLGLEEGLFQIDQSGHIRSELFSEDEPNSPKAMPLFRDQPLPPRFFRECVCQLSTASLLILKRGWLRNHVVIESLIESGGADILVRLTADRLLIGVKVKRNVPELEKLITDLRNCSYRGVHARDDCGFPQNHPIYEFCAVRRPVYFWAVAPGADVCFRMKYHGSSIELDRLPSLPPRSMIESGSIA